MAATDREPPIAEAEDAWLVAAYKRGDRAGFEELYRRHRDRVFALALGMLGDREAALDVTQDVFLRLTKRLGAFEGRAQFTTWLHRIVVNACYDVLRRREAVPVAQVDEIATEHHADPDTALRLDIATALDELDPDQRTVVVLTDLIGYRYREVAEILDIPLGTVQSRLARARATLAHRLSGNIPSTLKRPNHVDQNEIPPTDDPDIGGRANDR